MRNKETLPDNTAKRLPKYYRCLRELYKNGVMRISSAELASLMDFNPSVIRQDFSAIDAKGHKGYGYSVKNLFGRISDILCIRDNFSAVVIGNGELADLIAKTGLFTRRGVRLIGRFGFDTNGDGSVTDMKYFESFADENDVDIAIFAMDEKYIEKTCELVKKTKIKGIINYTDRDISAPDDNIFVRNIHMEDGIMDVCYEIGYKNENRD